ncbi:enoyl-CoA hydratase/isomerase family protein, partial [Micromonospora chersina]
AVHGFALGGGFELALSCDVIVADPTAVVGLPEVSVGVIPGGGGTQLLPRRVGAARAAELIFTARRVEAPEARELGLVDVLVEEGRDREEALALGARMAANSPVGLRAAKKALRLGFGMDLRAGLEVEDAAWRSVAFSGDRAEGVAAFNIPLFPLFPLFPRDKSVASCRMATCLHHEPGPCSGHTDLQTRRAATVRLSAQDRLRSWR